MKQRTTVLLGILISGVILALILDGVDLERVQNALVQARYVFVVPSAAILGVALLTRALRWRVLLTNRLPLDHTFHILNISYLVNSALPFRLGEVARVFLAARVRPPVPMLTSLSTILVERLLDLLTVIGMLGIVLALLEVPSYVTSAGALLGAGSLAGMAALVVLARNHGFAYRLLATAQRVLPVLGRWDLAPVLARFLDGLAPLASRRSALLAVGWSLVSWFLSVAAGYILMYAFFPRADWLTTTFFIVMASLAVSVPYAPGAVGPYEAGVILALNLTGFNRPEGAAVAFAVVMHVMTTGVYVLFGTIGLIQQGVTLGQVMQGARGLDSGAQPAAPGPSES